MTAKVPTRGAYAPIIDVAEATDITDADASAVAITTIETLLTDGHAARDRQ